MSLVYKTTPDSRRNKLKQLLIKKNFLRIIEVHSGLSAIIAESMFIEKMNNKIEFDGFWESSFTDSAVKGLPDAEIVGNYSRLHTIDEIFNVTSKPMIVDGDTGGSSSQFEYFVRQLERLGVSAVIIEDKIFPKRNSLDQDASQVLDDPVIFSQKIIRGKAAQITQNFMIIARLESLIAGFGIEDALNRAKMYIEAGADGIMIHSKSEHPNQVIEFAEKYNTLCKKIGHRPYLVCVPSTYNLIQDESLAEYGFNIIIHANHLLRASVKAMKNVALMLLSNDRGFEVETVCTPVKDVFSQVGFDVIKSKDLEYSLTSQLSAIIPAAGKDPILDSIPKSLIKISGQTILERQLANIKTTGVQKTALVAGYKKEGFKKIQENSNIVLYENPNFLEKHSLHSLFCAEKSMHKGFLLIYSDILFDPGILTDLLKTEEDIVLAFDSSYRYHKHDIHKKLDLVIYKRHHSRHPRSLFPSKSIEIKKIGKNIPIEEADSEFIGIAYFSEEGAKILRKVYHDCYQDKKNPFHEATSFDQASELDILQEIIDRGFKVTGIEVYQGWMEIHNQSDIEIANQELNRKIF